MRSFPDTNVRVGLVVLGVLLALAPSLRVRADGLVLRAPAAISPAASTPAWSQSLRLIGRVSLADRRDDDALWITSLSIFLGTYLVTGAMATWMSLDNGGRGATIAESWIPVVGPWLMVADHHGLDGTQIGAAVISGVLQAVSLATLIVALVTRDRYERVQLDSLAVGPIMTRGGGGVAIFGRM